MQSGSLRLRGTHRTGDDELQPFFHAYLILRSFIILKDSDGMERGLLFGIAGDERCLVVVCQRKIQRAVQYGIALCLQGKVVVRYTEQPARLVVLDILRLHIMVHGYYLRSIPHGSLQYSR